ncbi:von Willebrand factor type A [Oscillochloris trichoides DG-6]|uniref:von Willebrand factor type A n=1 Tax=Oscillochloris trichoides DG-6 TaxID=765420 RepID=E1IE50_9CHLR|nr:VWA domain-containing protein [Oscillochloris trichoides]EFO80510.1 von Willebrand factor type A [Oscillochloris trichoides DG-6]
MSLILQTLPQLISLPARSEAQICYAMITLATDAGGVGAPVNWALVADASRSMRIPIVSEEQFRELVRAGGAQEVLVDGVPVWQIAGPVPDAIRAQSPSALDYTVRALHSVVERLDRQDRFSLVACAEQALTLVPSMSGERRAELVAGITRLHSLRLGEATDLSSGMRLGLAELAHAAAPGTVRRLILLTDGFTENADACMALARQAAQAGVSISTLGLGGEFQDDLLTGLADVSGGRASFMRRADQIPAAVAAELDAARNVVAQALQLELHLPQGVEVRRVTRIAPSLAPLEASGDDPRRLFIHLGDLERETPIRILLELLAPPTPPRPSPDGARRRLCALRASSGNAEVSADLVAHYTPTPTAPPAALLYAAGRATAMRLQRRALEAANRGDVASAVNLLRAAAERLHHLGEPALAQAALHEAATLEATGSTSGVGRRELTYATRRLGEQEVS